MQKHRHSPEHIKAIVNRMNRAIGHFSAVRKMVEDNTDCADVLIQLAAVKSALNNIGREIMKEHLSHCIVRAAKTGEMREIDALNAAIDKFLK